MSLQNHINRLIDDHRTLDQEIHKLESTLQFSDIAIAEMKKHRLYLKDEIQRLKQLEPNHLPHKH